MGTFGDSWTLTKTSFRVIKEDKALLLFPLVSGLTMIAIIIMFALGFFTLSFYGTFNSSAGQAVVVVLAIVFYFLLLFVSVFFQGALVGAAMMKLNGGQPTFGDGMKAARANIGRLLAWALISGTVLLLIRMISSRFRGITGLIISTAAGLAWGAMTYFVVPVIMFEKEGAWKSFKRSASLFAHTFGRTFISNIVLGLLLALGFILGIVLLVAGAYVIFATAAPLVAGVVLVLLGLAVLIFMVILSSAAEGVLVTALYRFATTGQAAPGMIPPQYLGANPQASGAAMSNQPLRFGGTSNTVDWSSQMPPAPPPLPPMSQ